MAQEEDAAKEFRDLQKVGEIPDTTLDIILDYREDLKPIYGSEEIYIALNKKNTQAKTGAVLNLEDVSEIADAKDIYWGVTVSGLVRFDKESLAGPGSGVKRFPIITTGTTGTTQILVYNKEEDPDTSRPIAGNKLYKVFRVTVTEDNLVDLMQQMRAKIGKVEGLEIRIIGDQVVVDGNVVIPRDLRRVLTVVQNYQAKNRPVEFLGGVSPLALQLLSEKMQDEINGGRDRPTNIYVRVLNGRFVLEGSVDKRIDRDIAEQTCRAMIQDQFQLDPKSVLAPRFENLPECMLRIRIRPGAPTDPDPIITVRVDFVTLVRNYIKAFNFKWGPGVSADATMGYSTDIGRFIGSFQAIITGLFPTLSTLSRNGHARVLKSATLLVRDGDDTNAAPGEPPTAYINETIEIPYLTPGSTSATGQSIPPQWNYKPIQTKIGLKVRSIPGTDKINIGIEATQTEPQDKPAPDAPPGTLAYEVKTSLVVSNGDSAALGGMISERRLISLGRDPANTTGSNNDSNNLSLFKLSRFHEFTDQKNQMIIFVTPTKIRNASEGTESLKRKFRLKK
jgi:pilus assembly protein CpaC